MPTWLAIVALVVLMLVVLLALGGAVAISRRERSGRRAFDEQLRRADRHLADARAQDRGWERSALEAAARQAILSERPDLSVSGVALVQVEDRPGMEDDRAILRATTGSGAIWVTLARRSGGWVAESID